MEDTTIIDLFRPDPSPSGQIDIKEAARNLGLEPVQAWISGHTQSNKRSKSADRTRRSRQKTIGQGSKQISVTLPIELHGPIKVLALRTRAGEPAAQVLTEVFALVVDKQIVPSSQETQPAGIVTSELSWFGGLPYWRRLLISMLLPRKVRGTLLKGGGGHPKHSP